jgi:glycosyltransferase involved in cell wall biosynthesis
MRVAAHFPAWLLGYLPAKFARQHSRSLVPPANLPATSQVKVTASRQLLVDVSVVHQSDARTGIQRVVRSLLLQLLQEPPAGYVVCPVFATRQHGYCHAVPGFFDQPALAEDAPHNPVCVQPNDMFLGLDLAAHLLPRHQAQVLGWKKTGVKVHVMVYDLLPLQHPEWFNPRTTRNFKRWIRWLAVYADSAICISEHVQTELRAWLGAKFGFSAAELASTAISLGADIDASAPSVGLPANAEFLLARMRSTPAVLMVGTLEPRKGHDQALAAFELLWQGGSAAPMLVVAGRPGWKTEALQEALRTHSQAGKKLFWLEDVSDEFLARLYGSCRGALVASRGEGFGLPLIEAARHGKPVLARDIPVFRQIPGADLTYFNSNTAGGLASAIQNWLNAPPLAHAHVAASFPTWQRSSAALIQALGLTQQPTDTQAKSPVPEGIGAAA